MQLRIVECAGVDYEASTVGSFSERSEGQAERSASNLREHRRFG